jgi:quercetin dioxygenase-like cupin family protein
MTRTLMILVAGAAVGVGGPALCDDRPPAGPKVVTERDIAEKLDGKEAKVVVVEVALEPGRAGAPHRHPGPVFGYVLEGEYEWAIDDQPAKVLKAGDTFYEPAGCLHRVSKNPGKVKARILATMVCPRDAKQITTPEPKK